MLCLYFRAIEPVLGCKTSGHVGLAGSYFFIDQKNPQTKEILFDLTVEWTVQLIAQIAKFWDIRGYFWD